MLTQTELGFTEESWNKIDNYSEDNILDSNTWPLQREDTINEAFAALMKTLPQEIVSSKNLSELEILVLAMEYIKGLESVLDKDEEMKE
jgi:hypothetical protein